MNNIYAVTAVWVGLALIASMVSIRIGVSVALVEIVVGAVAGNLPLGHFVQQTDYTTFLAALGSVVLDAPGRSGDRSGITQAPLARQQSIGAVSFFLIQLAALSFCAFVLHWDQNAAQIGGIALSTTSVAVVYAVMIETGLNRQDLGKLILAACFVTTSAPYWRSVCCSRTMTGCCWCSCSRPSPGSCRCRI